MVCPTCEGKQTVKGSPRKCEQCSGRGAKAKLGYCEVSDPFSVGKCDVCFGKCFLFKDDSDPSSSSLASTPPPSSPLSAFSKHYGTEITPSKYGFYRQSSTRELEKIMLPDLLSAVILFSLTSPPSDISKRRPPPRPPRLNIGSSSSFSSSSSSDSSSSNMKRSAPNTETSSSSLSSSDSPVKRNPLMTSDSWRVGVKKEITVFYPAQVRSSLKRMVHCLRSLGPVAKRMKEKDGMVVAAEKSIALKWVHEMVDGRHLLGGDGYGINLGYVSLSLLF